MDNQFSNPDHAQGNGRTRRWIALAIGLLAGGMLLGGGSFVGLTPHAAEAAAAPITQCNNITASNVGGQGISCSVTVVNYVTSTGAASPTQPSTVTVTVCVGAAGVIAAGAGTCTTNTELSAEPITQITQCNGVGNGGGGVVLCTATITTHYETAPVQPLSGGTIYQCVGSEITGPGAPAICTPENTPGVNSVGAATVGQCNGSGNGGTSVGFVCSAGAGSVPTAPLTVHIDQCNGSANGGGSLLRCQATVNGQVQAAPSPTATVSASASPTGSASPTASTTSTFTSTASASPTVVTTGTPVPTSVPATATPGGFSSNPGTTPVPRPPSTGSGFQAEPAGPDLRAVWLLIPGVMVLLVTISLHTRTALARAREEAHARSSQ